MESLEYRDYESHDDVSVDECRFKCADDSGYVNLMCENTT